MQRFRFPGSILALCATVACGGSDGPTQSNGVFQIASLEMNPQVVNCGLTPTSPPKNVASPDSIEFKIELVNTTKSDITLNSIGLSGTVTVASNAGDVGASVLNLSTLPFTPATVLVRASDGDVMVTARLGMEPYCNTKPPGFSGTQDLLINVRVKTSSGEYLSLPQVLRVRWNIV
jgi:hypothetical protein